MSAWGHITSDKTSINDTLNSTTDITTSKTHKKQHMCPHHYYGFIHKQIIPKSLHPNFNVLITSTTHKLPVSLILFETKVGLGYMMI